MVALRLQLCTCLLRLQELQGGALTGDVLPGLHSSSFQIYNSNPPVNDVSFTAVPLFRFLLSHLASADHYPPDK